MILGPILFFLMLSIVAIWRGYRRLAAFVLTLTTLTLAALCAGPLPGVILSRLQNEPVLEHPAWGKDNVIVVIGLGTVRQGDLVRTHVLGHSRVFEAARLFQECRASRRRCLMVTSGGDPSGTGESEARVMARDLVTLGVPTASILIEDESRNTFANAKLTRRMLNGNRFDYLVLVTSGFHMKRARRYFESFFEKVTPAPADLISVGRGLIPSARTLAFVELAAHEFAGEVHFDLYNYLGWN